MKTAQMGKVVETIAATKLGVASLQVTNSGRDFHEVAVWTIREALEAAYKAGLAAASKK